MAKTESTAVNELINLVQTATPLKPDPSEDLMFRAPASKKVSPPRVAQTTIPPLRGAGEVSPLPRARAPQGTQRGVPAINGDKSPAKPAVRLSTAPAMSPIPSIKPWTSAEGAAESDALPEAMRPTPQNLDPRATRPSLPPPIRQSSPGVLTSAPRMSGAQRTEAPPTTPIAAPFETPHVYPSAAPYLAHIAPDMTSHQAWFDQSGGTAQPVEVEVEIELGTAPVRKTTDWKSLIPKLIAPTLGLMILGVAVGGYFAYDSGGNPDVTKVDLKATAPDVAKAEPKQTEPKQAVEPKADEPPKAKTEGPALAPVAGRPELVDVRIDSTPDGATVMLVDRGKTMFLGTTPISTSIDSSRQYDLVFTYADRPTRIEHLDPKTTTKVSVTLDGKKQTEVKARAPKPAVKTAVKAEAPKAEPKPKNEAPKLVEDPVKKQPETQAPVESKPPAAPAGDGVLMISSKPPCEIWVNGASTGLTTPQRALKLPVGKHKITLVNEAEKIRKTVPVTITADQPTKLIENFMK